MFAGWIHWKKFFVLCLSVLFSELLLMSFLSLIMSSTMFNLLCHVPTNLSFCIFLPSSPVWWFFSNPPWVFYYNFLFSSQAFNSLVLISLKILSISFTNHYHIYSFCGNISAVAVSADSHLFPHIFCSFSFGICGLWSFICGNSLEPGLVLHPCSKPLMCFFRAGGVTIDTGLHSS